MNGLIITIKVSITCLMFLILTKLATAQTALIADFNKRGILTVNPSDIFRSIGNVDDLWWDVQPIPLYYYSREGINNQKLINNRIAESIVTFSPLDQDCEWTAIDYAEITPYTWRWVDLEMPHEDSTVTIMHLRRPNSWITENNVFPGNKIYFSWEEVGAEGWAKVLKIRPNLLDTRLWEENRHGHYVNRPIIGKFEHKSDNVYELHVHNSKPIGVTGEHPIWSSDRKKWVPAVELKIGEQIRTYAGIQKLLRRTKLEGVHTVYNIEVYKSHNYFVSPGGFLVHNGPVCSIGIRSVADVVAGKTVIIDGISYEIRPGLLTTEIRAPFAEYYASKMSEAKGFDFENMIDPITGNQDKMVFQLFNDGVMEIQEGHTRFIASQLAGVRIPFNNEEVVEIIKTGRPSSGANSWDRIRWDRSKRTESNLRMFKMMKGD